MYDIQMGEPHPQATSRSTRTFRDQHGRNWSAIIDQKTGHPVSPPSPKFEAPVYPPENYVRPAPGDAGDLFIDYPAWHRDLLEAWQNYEQRRFDIAHAEYKDDPGAALANPTPFLLKAIGDAPLHPNVPRACMAGNQWILGFATAKPQWAYEYFPDRKEQDDRPEFLSQEFPDADPEEGSEEQETGFPKKARGVGRWELSDGSVIAGTREYAIEAQKALEEFAGT